MFQGSMVALVTPMYKTGEIDEKSLRALLETHIAAGTDAIMVNSVTGENGTLADDERAKIIKIAVETCKGRIPLIAGTGSCSTAETIKRTEQARALGVDACLIITPYHNKPTQEGLYQHYQAVATTVAVPIILYNHPGRTACDLLPETIKRLSQFSNIVGVKEGTRDLSRAREIMALCGDKLDLYTADDDMGLAFILQGGKGVMSVTANVAPKAMHEMCAAALAKDIPLAGKLNNRLMSLHKTLFLETNPIPVKWAVRQLGLIKEGIRLPLTPLADQYHEVVREAMKENGVI